MDLFKNKLKRNWGNPFLCKMETLYSYKSLHQVNIKSSLVKELLEIAIGETIGENKKNTPKIYFYDGPYSDFSRTEIKAASLEFGLIANSKGAAVLGMKLIMLLEENVDNFWYLDSLNLEDREYSVKELYNLLTQDDSEINEYNLTDIFESSIFWKDYYQLKTPKHSLLKIKFAKTIAEVKTIYTLETIKTKL